MRDNPPNDHLLMAARLPCQAAHKHMAQQHPIHPKHAEHQRPQLPSYRAMQQQMIDRLPTYFTHTTPIHNNDITLS